MLERYAAWVLKHRVLILVTTLGITLLFTLSILKWARVEADISKYLPKDDPSVVRFTRAGERFGGVTVALTMIEFEDVFTAESIATLDRMTEELKQVPGVSWVISLTTIDDVQETTVDGEKAVSVGKFVDREVLPKTPAELDRLRRYVLGKEHLVGVVVSADARFAAVACNVLEDSDRAEVATEIERRARQTAGGRPLYFSGFPNWIKSTSQMILQDLSRLVPIVILVVIGVLLLSFRSLRGVLLPLCMVVISSIWAMGLMAALRWPITMLSNVIPVLMMALGTAYAIHLLHRYNEVIGTDPAGALPLRRALTDVFVPILGAGVTTIAGFLSFLTTNLSFIRETGWISAFGITAAMVLALTALPALLSYLKPLKPRIDHSGERELRGIGRWVDRTGLAVIRHRRPVVVSAVLVCAAFAACIPLLEHHFNMVEYFPEDSEMRQGDAMMQQKLGGNTPMWVTVDGDVKDPHVLRTLSLVSKYLRSIPGIHNVRAISLLVSEMHGIMAGHRSIPETREGVANLWLNMEGKDVLGQLVSRDQKQALVSGMSETADTGRLRALLGEIEAFLKRLPSRAVRVSLREAEPGLARLAREALLDQVALMVTLDLRSRLRRRSFDEREVRGWIQGAWEQVLPVPPAYLQRFQAYLTSGEAELEIQDDAARGRLAAKAAEWVASGIRSEQVLAPSLLKLLTLELSPDGAPKEQARELLDEAGEAMPLLARSLLQLADEADGEARAELILSRILARLPPEAGSDSMLRQDLLGDLWELNTTTAYLDAAVVGRAGDFPIVTVSMKQTGFHEVSVHIDDGIVFSQLSSLFFAVLVAFVFIAAQFRSVIAGLFGMIPMTFTLLINFGVMGLLRIELEPATILIASVVVGVGVDYPIHMLSRMKREVIWKGGNLEAAADGSLRSVGRAILINALAVLGGQLVFLFGDLIPLHYFGGMMALAMVVAALTAVTVMPAAIVAMRPRFLAGLAPSKPAEKGPAV